MIQESRLTLSKVDLSPAWDRPCVPLEPGAGSVQRRCDVSSDSERVCSGGLDIHHNKRRIYLGLGGAPGWDLFLAIPQ